MSNVIDSKVVEMKFDNQQFEQNVQTSLSTLDRLKAALSFKDSSKAFSGISEAAKNINFSGITDGVEAVSVKMNALDVIAKRTFERITDYAITTGANLVKSLSIDNVTAGFDKFGEKTQSVKTLTAQGYALEEVNEQLDRLNWFTDETSYNFTDMVNNIAKFTASGQDLDTSVTAMEGIANWAALSGQNAVTASRAMYQLSQAMGKGALKYDDYKSIQNASMDTREFRQHCLDAAVALGQLQESSEGVYKTLASGKEFTIDNFAEYLSQEQWLNSDVMMKVFNDYAGAVDQIYEYAEEKGITASEAIEELGGKIDEFGLKAFLAAQEARTLTDVFDSVKDAVSTGFMNTFEIIIGDADQATELYTNMANSLYDVFAEPVNQMNEVLEEALGDSYRTIKKSDLAHLELDTTTYTALEKVLVDTARKHGIEIDNMIRKNGNFKESLKENWLTEDIFSEALDRISNFSDATVEDLDKVKEAALDVIKGSYGDTWEERIPKLEEAGYNVDAVRKYVNNLHKLTEGSWKFTDATFEEADALMGSAEALSNMSDEELKNIGLTQEEIEGLRELAASADKTKSPLNDLYKNIKKGNGRELLLESFGNIGEAINSIVDPIKEAFSNVFPPVTADRILEILNRFKEFTSTLKLSEENSEKVKTVFTAFFTIVRAVGSAIGKIFSIVAPILGEIARILGGTILNLLSRVSKRLIDVFGKLKESGTFDKILNSLSTAFEKLKNFLGPVIQLLGERLGDAIVYLIDKIPSLVDWFSKLIAKFKESERFKNISKWFKEGKNKILDFLKTLDVAKAFDTFGAALLDLKDKIAKFFDDIFTGNFSLSDAFSGIGEWFDTTFKDNPLLQSIGSFFKDLGINVGDTAEDGAKTIWDKIQEFKEDIKKAFESLKGLFTSDTLSSIGKTLHTAFNYFISYQVLDTFLSLKRRFKAVSYTIKGVGRILSGAAKLLRAKARDLNSKAFLRSILSITIAIGAITAAILILGNTPEEVLIQGIKYLGIVSAIVVALYGIISFIRSKFSSNESDNPIQSLFEGIAQGAKAFGKRAGIGAMVMGIGAGLLLLAFAVGKFASMPLPQLAKGLGVVVGLIVALSASLKLIGNWAYLKGVASALLGISVAIFVLSASVKSFGSMKFGELMQGLIGVIALVISLALAMRLMKMQLGKDSKDFMSVKTGMNLLAMAAAISIIAIAVKSLGKMKFAEIATGLAGVGLIMAGLTASMYFLKDVKVKAMAGLLAMAVAVGIIGLVVKKLSEISDVNKVAIVASSLSMITATMTAAMAAFTRIPFAAVFAGIGKLALIVAAVIGIISLLGGIDVWTKGGFSSVLEGGGNILQKVGEALGKFFAGITAGLFATSGDIGAKLGEFAENAMPFFENIDKILPGIQGISDLGKAVKNIGGGSIKGADGLSDVDRFLQSLTPLADGVKEFATAFEGVEFNDATIASAEGLMSFIAALYSTEIQKKGGWKQRLDGEADVEGYVSSLADLAKGLKVLATLIDSSTFTPDKIEAAKGLLSFVAALYSNEIPKKGGLDRVFDGTADITGYIDSLPKLGRGLAVFAHVINASTFDPDKIAAAEGIASFVAALYSNEIPVEHGGIIGLFKSEPNITGYVNSLIPLAVSLGLFGTIVSLSTYDETKIAAAKGIASFVAALLQDMPPTTSIEGSILGFAYEHKNFDEYVTAFGKLGISLAKFSLAINLVKFDDSKITAATTLATNLAEVLNVGNIPTTELEEKTLLGYSKSKKADFDGYVKAFGQMGISLAKFSLAINLVKFDESQLTLATTLATNLAEVLKVGNIPTTIKTTGLLGYTTEHSADFDGYVTSFETLGVSLGRFSDEINKHLFDEYKINKVEQIANFLNALSKERNLSNSQGGLLSFINVLKGDDALATFGDDISKFGDGIAKYAEKLSEADISDKKISQVERIGTSFAELSSSIVGIGSTQGTAILSDLPALGLQIEEFGISLNRFYTMYLAEIDTSKIGDAGLLIGALADAYTAFVGLGEPSDNMSSMGTALEEAFKIFSSESVVNGLSESIKTLFEEANTYLTDGFDSLIKSSSEKIEELNKAFSGSSGDSSSSTSFDKAIVDALDNIKTAFEDQSISESAATLMENIKTAISDTESFTESGKNLGTAVKDGVLESLSGLSRSLSTQLSQSKTEAIKDVTDGFKTSASKLGENIKNGIISGMSSLSKNLNTILSSAKRTVSGFSSSFYSAGSTLAGKLKDGMASKNSTISSIYNSSVSNASSNLYTYKAGFYNVGVILGASLVSGMDAKLRDIRNKASELGSAANQGVKAATGVNSPSKIWIGVGESLDEGLIIGMEHGIKSIASAAGDMGNTANKSLTNSISKIGSLIENGINTQPTIKPVVDLSDVQNGVGLMNSMFGSSYMFSPNSNLNAIMSLNALKNQNATNNDIISAIRDLSSTISGGGDTYNINGITYDDGSNITDAVRTLVRAARMERRV